MRSNRLAVLSVAVGSALLGWATAGVTAVAGDLGKAAPAPERIEHHGDQHCQHGGRGGL